MRLKEHYKLRQFVKYADCSDGLRVLAASLCMIVDGGKISIRRLCDVSAVLRAWRKASISLDDKAASKLVLLGLPVDWHRMPMYLSSAA